jgi:hypothetical protein
MLRFALKVVFSVKTGIRGICRILKRLDSGAGPGPDPGFADGMRKKCTKMSDCERSETI